MNAQKENEIRVLVRPLLSGELDPTSKTAAPPVCHFNKKHLASHLALEPMRGEWLTCLPCAEDGRKPRPVDD